MQNELAKAREELRAATESHGQLLAVLSHELRAPLTPTLATVELLLHDPALPPHVRDGLLVVQRNVELEARLVNDLLDVTHATKGKMRLHLREVDVHDVIRDSASMMDAHIRAKFLDFNLRLDAARPHVSGDPDRLHQVVWNLIRNAVKFTPMSGRVVVSSENDGSGQLIVTVSDTGVGITPDALPKLFVPFEQAGRWQTFGGLGLGLAISKSLMELHGGTIAAESGGESQGATFTLTFPKTVTPLAAPPQPQGDAASTGVAVLLVEDDPDTLRAMTRLLERWGHRVVPAGSINAALQAATMPDLSLLVSDIGLPDGTGFELMSQLRERFAGRAVALTGYGMEEDVKRSREAGFARHLVKPVDFERLRELIVQLGRR